MEQEAAIILTDADIKHYTGMWYEIGRYHHWIESDITHVTSEYKEKEGYIEIVNQYRRKKSCYTIKGRAQFLSHSNNLKLQVQYVWPFKSEYCIIDLDTLYQWIVISNTKRNTLLILYRKPEISDKILRPIIFRLINKGFDLSRMVWTKQESNS